MFDKLFFLAKTFAYNKFYLYLSNLLKYKTDYKKNTRHIPE
jgi:hypothetical protein